MKRIEIIFLIVIFCGCNSYEHYDVEYDNGNLKKRVTIIDKSKDKYFVESFYFEGNKKDYDPYYLI